MSFYGEAMKKRVEQPLSDSMGQLEHQIVQTFQGNVLDPDEIHPDVVEENGIDVVPKDEYQLKEYIKDAITPEKLIETFTDNAHETLIRLLAMQDNKHPLKKGGVGIAYRTDALIMHCKMEFSSDENIVFDAILGTMSSFPENKTYKIEPRSFQDYSSYKNPNYLYEVFRKGTKKIKERHLEFEGLGPNGEDTISLPWYNILRYHDGKSDGNAYIEFVPSDFFKDLALCSSLVHGAYGSLKVTTNLQGKYAIAVYWYLENKKKYREYPNATPGVFRVSIEELKHQFSIPESYLPGDIKRRVLEPSKKSINAAEGCDFTFDYTPQTLHGVTVGYLFEVKTKNYIETTNQMNIEDKPNELLMDQIKMFLSTSGIDLSNDEIYDVYNQAQKYNKDGMDMMKVIIAFKQRLDDRRLDPVEDKVKYLCAMIGQTEKKNRSNNSFNHFTQNTYNFKELEEKLLDN